MGIKITSSKVSDILNDQAAYELDAAKRKERYDAQHEAWERARYDIYKALQDEIEKDLAQFTLLHFIVTVRAHSYGGKGLEINIECNEREKFDDSSALSWSYRARLDKDGQLFKETSSWSGLKACTSEQIESLKETVKALEYLNTIDWPAKLDQTLPSYRDYITESDPAYDKDKRNFKQELKEARVEEAIGQNKLIKGVLHSGKYYRNQVYYGILSETPSMYTVFELNLGYHIENYKERGYETLADCVAAEGAKYPYRVKKERFLNECIPAEIETIEY